MTLNGVVALMCYFTEFGSFRGAHYVKVVEDVVVKSSRSLSYRLMSFLLKRPLQLPLRHAATEVYRSLHLYNRLDCYWLVD